jgi:predicted GIY-YIG superfamily endonuclease
MITLTVLAFVVILFIAIYIADGYDTKKSNDDFNKHHYSLEIVSKDPYVNKGYSVYLIKNKINRMIYVGMTNDFNRRKAEHFDPHYRYKNRKLLYKFMEQLGPNNFEIIEIFKGITKQSASYAEARLIKSWSTIYPYGYNVADEYDNRQLGLNVAKYNKDFFYAVKAIANFDYKNKLLEK